MPNRTAYLIRQRQILGRRLDKAMARNDLPEVARIDSKLRKLEREKRDAQQV